MSENNTIGRNKQFDSFINFWLTLEKLNDKNFILSRHVYIDFVDGYRKKGV